MHLFFTATAFIVLFLKCALSAPTTGHHEDACIRLRNSSLELNKIAKFVSRKVHNGKDPVDNYSIPNQFEWIEAKDKCDPGNLLNDPEQTCIRKLFATLMSYNSAVETITRVDATISESPCCPELDMVKPRLKQLQKDMKECDKATRNILKATPVSSSQPTASQSEYWKKSLMCRYTVDRLFSFSIMVARVFAVGDPANHAQGSAEKCI